MAPKQPPDGRKGRGKGGRPGRGGNPRGRGGRGDIGQILQALSYLVGGQAGYNRNPPPAVRRGNGGSGRTSVKQPSKKANPGRKAAQAFQKWRAANPDKSLFEGQGFRQYLLTRIAGTRAFLKVALKRAPSEREIAKNTTFPLFGRESKDIAALTAALESLTEEDLAALSGQGVSAELIKRFKKLKKLLTEALAAPWVEPTDEETPAKPNKRRRDDDDVDGGGAMPGPFGHGAMTVA